MSKQLFAALRSLRLIALLAAPSLLSLLLCVLCDLCGELFAALSQLFRCSLAPIFPSTTALGSTSPPLSPPQL